MNIHDIPKKEDLIPMFDEKTQISSEEFNTVVETAKNSITGVGVDNHSDEDNLILKLYRSSEEADEINIPVATSVSMGIMSKEDKKKLDSLSEGADGLIASEVRHIVNGKEYKTLVPDGETANMTIWAPVESGDTGLILQSGGEGKAPTWAYQTDLHVGGADRANFAGSADEAVKAQKDGDGNIITNTYATKEEIENNDKINEAYDKAENSIPAIGVVTTTSGVSISYKKQKVGSEIETAPIPTVTQTTPGLMSASDKKKLDSLSSNSGNSGGTTPSFSADEVRHLVNSKEYVVYAPTGTSDNMSIYAPTSAGSVGDILISSGKDKAPTWGYPTDIKAGDADHADYADTATKAINDNIGRNIVSTYLTKDELGDIGTNAANALAIANKASQDVSNQQATIESIEEQLANIGDAGAASAAKDVIFTTGTTGLTKTNVQGAIEEVMAKVSPSIKDVGVRWNEQYNLVIETETNSGDFDTIILPSASSSSDGVLSKEDKATLDSLSENAVTGVGIDNSSDTDNLILKLYRSSEEADEVNIPVASQSTMGIMSKDDKKKLDSINQGNIFPLVSQTINGDSYNVATNEKSSLTLYAPTEVGSEGYILTSTGSGAPGWIPQADIHAGSADSATFADEATNAVSASKATKDGDGNIISSTYIKKDTKLNASSSIHGVGVSLTGSYSSPKIEVSVNGGAIIDGSSSIVNANDVYDFVKNNAASKDTFSTGKDGLVPAPSANDSLKYLRGDGTWGTPDTESYSEATASSAGLMSAADKIKLDSIENSANAYSLPNATSTTLGGVKIGDNISINNGVISLTSGNVTSALGYTPPTKNTEYGLATTTKDGLMSNAMVTKLNSAATTSELSTLRTNIENGTVVAGDSTKLGGASASSYAKVDSAIAATASHKGVSVTLGGTISSPSISVSVNGGTITDGSSSIVNANDVHDYVKSEIANQATFTTKNKGLVPASGLNTSMFLRGDGQWASIPEASVPSGVMIWGGILNTAAYATDYSVGTILKVNTSESLYILENGSLISSSLSAGTNVVVSYESYMSGTSYNSGNVFVIL